MPRGDKFYQDLWSPEIIYVRDRLRPILEWAVEVSMFALARLLALRLSELMDLRGMVATWVGASEVAFLFRGKSVVAGTTTATVIGHGIFLRKVQCLLARLFPS